MEKKTAGLGAAIVLVIIGALALNSSILSGQSFCEKVQLNITSGTLLEANVEQTSGNEPAGKVNVQWVYVNKTSTKTVEFNSTSQQVNVRSGVIGEIERIDAYPKQCGAKAITSYYP